MTESLSLEVTSAQGALGFVYELASNIFEDATIPNTERFFKSDDTVVLLPAGETRIKLHEEKISNFSPSTQGFLFELIVALFQVFNGRERQPVLDACAAMHMFLELGGVAEVPFHLRLFLEKVRGQIREKCDKWVAALFEMLTAFAFSACSLFDFVGDNASFSKILTLKRGEVLALKHGVTCPEDYKH